MGLGTLRTLVVVVSIVALLLLVGQLELTPLSLADKGDELRPRDPNEEDKLWQAQYKKLRLDTEKLEAEYAAQHAEVQKLERTVAELEGAVSRACAAGVCRPVAAGSSVRAEPDSGIMDFTGKNRTRLQFLFFRPRCCSGINNQIEEFWYASQLALLIGRGIVLPAVAENVTWDDPTMSRLHPFDLFYDVRVASQLVPTMTLMEWKRRCNSTFQLDIFPQRNQKIVQRKYELFLNITYQGAPRLVVQSYRDLIGRDLPDCLGVQWPSYLLDGMLSTEVRPGDPPLGCLVERNKRFERLRRHTIAAPHIMAAVAAYTAPLGAYLAVHVRVGDFRAWCRSSGRDRLKCPSYQDMGTAIAATAHEHGLGRVFVACAPHFMADTLAKLRPYAPNVTFHTFTARGPPFNGHPDVGGMAEAQICVEAPVFIGNAWSTWTRTVHQLRFTSGKKCTTTRLWNSATPWCPAARTPGPKPGASPP